MFDQLEWQLVGENTWVFGRKVRGIVRDIIATVQGDEVGWWRWWVEGSKKVNSAPTRSRAVEDCEVTIRKGEGMTLGKV